MARRKSLAKFIRDLQPEAKRRTVAVPGVPNLYCRISPTGRKSLHVARRPEGGGNLVWRELPLVLDMDRLTTADEDRIRELTREGALRIRQKLEAFPAAEEVETVQTVGDKWLERYVQRNKLASAGKIESRLARLVYPAIGPEPINSLKRRRLAELLDKIEDENGTTSAQRVYEDLNMLFGWWEGRDDEFRSPLSKALRRRRDGRGAARREPPSDRILRLLWPLCEQSDPFGGFVQTLILTAQRSEKVQQMRWRDIDADGVWKVREGHARAKSFAQVVPLPKMVIDVLERQPRIVGNPYVFASRRTEGPINGLSKAKKALDEKLEAVLRAEDPEAELPPWQLHGLRHLAKTLMARAGVSNFDSERVLGHSIKGIEGHYDHHDYETAIGRALKRLAAEVQRIVSPPPADGKVVDHPRRAGVG